MAQRCRTNIDGREWQWVRPDMRVRFPGKGWRYYELKTCMLSTSHYPTTRARRDARGRAGRRWGAQGRAQTEQRVYDGDGRHGVGGGKARTTDRETGWEGEGPGPFQRRWQEIGGIRVLAVGAYGEVSDSVRELLAEAAEVGATRLWRFCGCRTAQEALSVVASKMTARLGVAFVRAQAKLLRKRVHLAEPGERSERGIGWPPLNTRRTWRTWVTTGI